MVKRPQPVHIMWFRQDLRLADNPAWVRAAQVGTVLPIYILDNHNPGARHRMGAASRVWLHHALQQLNRSLDGKLNFFMGDPKAVFDDLQRRYDIQGIHWNRCYEPWRVKRDRALKEHFKAAGMVTHSSNGSLLWEPWQVLKADGTPYRVFTPFYRNGCRNAEPPRPPLSKPKRRLAERDRAAVALEALALLPNHPWAANMIAHWDASEAGAAAQLRTFLKQGIGNYKEGRNLPAKPCISRLSPHLHMGTISPQQVWYAARDHADNSNVDCFLSELGWREFSYSLLYHYPTMPKRNLQPKFDHFPWRQSGHAKLLRAWQQGHTGYPMVDAGMRELWQTGFMHNRVRMIVGSFLVKNLLFHWHAGERWFWDCLVDADLANNSASWQWVAGCGADAAPYFRIFNPVTQGEKFDPNGDYTRRYVPELQALPNKYLFKPWQAPAQVLHQAGVKLGHSYPAPIVDLKASREAALEAFAHTKQVASSS